MEMVCAAHAMEWSIDLEKALRSKKPGHAIEGISRMGPRLLQWSNEPQPNVAVYNMFGLVPGEDRLFANAILLRLADAFKFGDKVIRHAVVKAFLLERSSWGDRSKRKSYNGILLKARVHHQSELLQRVKSVFDTGDVESRALALVLFGCWADFAKDSAHVRYLILSSMVSADELVVKASLFAAGCLGELADDFASVVLEMLLNVIASSEMLSVQLAGARVFSRMGESYVIANRAYLMGQQLILDSLEEDFVVAMLVSLAKLAHKFTHLSPQQVDVLLSFLAQEKTLRLRATALRCLHFMFVGRLCLFPVGGHVIETLSGIVHEHELPLAMQCEALQILWKMVLSTVSNLSGDKASELAPLLTIIENSTVEPLTPKNLLAINILADLSTKLQERTETRHVRDLSLPSATHSISITIDRIKFMVAKFFDHSQKYDDACWEVKILLSLLLFLVKECPGVGLLVLDNIRLVVELFVGMHNNVTIEDQAELSVSEIRGDRGQDIRLKFVNYLHKFSLTCIEVIDGIGEVTNEILDKLKILVQCICKCCLFDCYQQVIFSILLHSRIVKSCLFDMVFRTCDLGGKMGSTFHNCLVEQERFTLDGVKKMLTMCDNWAAFKAGKLSACQGSWTIAAFVFDQLTSKVQSASHSSWLRSLAQFAQSEKEVQLVLFAKLGTSTVDMSTKIQLTHVVLSCNSGQDAVRNILEPNLTEVLSVAGVGICSSGDMLESISLSGVSIFFQRWFLALRAKVLRTVPDVLKSLDANQLHPDGTNSNGYNEKSVIVGALQQITEKSFCLEKLALELDLLASSFIGIDSRSSKIISTLALGCSVMAFAAGFVLFTPNLHAFIFSEACGLEESKKKLRGRLIQNLAGRLWSIDEETCANLCLLTELTGLIKNCSHLHPRNRTLNIDGEARDILQICKFAVSEIISLHNKAKGSNESEALYQVSKQGLQLLHETIIKWMFVPFRAPEYFFKVGSCVRAELLVSCPDASNLELSILPGFHLSLNVCLQLRNFPTDVPVQVSKLYCVLYCSSSFQEPTPTIGPNEPKRLDYRSWEVADMVQMNEKLFRYVTKCTKKTDDNDILATDEHTNKGNGNVHAFVQFELYSSRQGFSSCFLDVSRFPPGSYRMKWHSCCIDNRGSYWSLLPLNEGPVFTVQKPHLVA